MGEDVCGTVIGNLVGGYVGEFEGLVIGVDVIGIVVGGHVIKGSVKGLGGLADVDVGCSVEIVKT